MTLLEVADLSAVWIEADVFEKDIALLRGDSRSRPPWRRLPTRFRGKVALVYPQMDSATRTNRVRFEVENPRGELRPGMYATVRISIPLGASSRSRALRPAANAAGRANGAREELLAVPERAVIDTGAKQIVYVERRAGPVRGGRGGARDRAAATSIRCSRGCSRAIGRGRRGLPDRCRNAAQSGRGRDLLRRQRRPQSSGPSATPRPLPRRGESQAQTAGAPAAEPLAARTWRTSRNCRADELALAQAHLPDHRLPLGSMGVPEKVTLNGQPVFLCCPGAWPRPAKPG